ncbi:arrestin domain-containing protein 3 [Ciona intestinalis]
MGKIKVAITFTNDKNKYKTGDVVSGNASIEVLENPTKVLWLKVQMIGFCKVKWTKGSGDDEKTYKGREEYFVKDSFIWGGESQPETSISTGNHLKPFSFTIPHNCPSSFMSRYGDIFYGVQVVYLKPGLLSTEEITALPFMLQNPVDLTSEPRAAHFFIMFATILQSFFDRYKVQGEQEDSCCCCSKSSAKFDLTTDKAGYVPGDKVIFNGFIDNGSAEPMKYTMILIQNVTCFGKRSDFSLTSSGNTKQKEKEFSVAKWKSEPIPSNQRKTLRNEATLTIPDVVATGLYYCNIIDVAYTLQVRCTLPGLCGASMDLQPMTVTIGSKISDETEQTYIQAQPTAPQYEFSAYLRPTTSVPASQPSDIVGVTLEPAKVNYEPPPPSYGEVMSKDKSNPSGPPAPTQYYDWSQSAFTYN